MTQLKFGLEIGRFGGLRRPNEIVERLRQTAAAAEQAGMNSLWLWDHFAQWSQQSYSRPRLARRCLRSPILESWTTLGFLAAVTKTIELGVLVSGVTHRHPAVLVKQASTLDVLAAGRSYFGIGAAWNVPEHRAFGIPFPPLAQRYQLLEDTVRLARRAWSGERGEFRGQVVRLSQQADFPSPVRVPHPPILIGGGGERKTLRLVAQYADACNFGGSPDEFRRKIRILREHCNSVGRDFDEIERTTTIQLSDGIWRGRRSGAAQMARHLGAIVAAGAQHLIFGVRSGNYEDAIGWLAADVIPCIEPSIEIDA